MNAGFKPMAVLPPSLLQPPSLDFARTGAFPSAWNWIGRPCWSIWEDYLPTRFTELTSPWTRFGPQYKTLPRPGRPGRRVQVPGLESKSESGIRRPAI